MIGELNIENRIEIDRSEAEKYAFIHESCVFSLLFSILITMMGRINSHLVHIAQQVNAKRNICKWAFSALSVCILDLFYF